VIFLNNKLYLTFFDRINFISKKKGKNFVFIIFMT
jgi:hypothetical protein